MPNRENEPGDPEDLTQGIVKYSAMFGTGVVGAAALVEFINKPSVVGGAVFVISVVAEVVELKKL